MTASKSSSLVQPEFFISQKCTIVGGWREKKLYLFFLVGFIEFFIFFNRGLMKTVDKKKKILKSANNRIIYTISCQVGERHRLQRVSRLRRSHRLKNKESLRLNESKIRVSDHEGFCFPFSIWRQPPNGCILCVTIVDSGNLQYKSEQDILKQYSAYDITRTCAIVTSLFPSD